jgi:hypothetical protein
LGSCSKYEESPAFSLRIKKARLAGVWKVEKYVYSDGTAPYVNSDDNGTIKYTKDNKVNKFFTFFGIQLEVSGEWKFIKDKEWLRVTLDLNGQEVIEDSKILRLKNDELWLEDANGKETHYVPA